MADLRKAFEEAEQKKLLLDNGLREKQIAELNKFHRRKVTVELLPSGPFNMNTLGDTRKVTGVLMRIERKVGSCGLDYANPKDLSTFPISYVVSVELA